MAYRRRYRRSYYRPRRRYYRRRLNRFRRKISRALRQKDCSRVIVSSKPETVTHNFVSLENGTWMTTIVPLTPLNALLGSSVKGIKLASNNKLYSFDNFSKLFDQFKINACRAKISLISQPTSIGTNAIQIRTCLDHNGVNDKFAEALINVNTTPDKTNILIANKYFESYSSFYTKLMNQGDLYSIYKSFYPTGLQERGFWYGCSFQPKWTDTEILMPDIDYPFKPVYCFQFVTNGLTTNQTYSCTYTLQWEFDITFKGQRNLVEDISST